MTVASLPGGSPTRATETSERRGDAGKNSRKIVKSRLHYTKKINDAKDVEAFASFFYTFFIAGRAAVSFFDGCAVATVGVFDAL